jgi:hypothetical protein
VRHHRRREIEHHHQLITLCRISSTVQGCHTASTFVPRWEPFSYAPCFVFNTSCSSELAQAITIIFSSRYLRFVFSAKQHLGLHAVAIGRKPRCCICRHAADGMHAYVFFLLISTITRTATQHSTSILFNSRLHACACRRQVSTGKQTICTDTHTHHHDVSIT